MVKRLYDILLLFKEYVVFALLLVVSLSLLALNDTPQLRSLRALALFGAGAVEDAFGFIPNYFNLRSENATLRELNLTLSDDVNRLREAGLENARLRTLLGFKQQAEHKYVSANVIGRTLQLLRNTVTLDIGEQDGVRINMPIVSEGGLVGKIVATSKSYSIGQLLLNKELRISAKIQRTRVDGIIRWDGGRSLSLQNVVKSFDVQTGDVVVTSEYSSIFPSGIRIGVVNATHQLPGSLFQGVDVTPSADFLRLEQVFVIITAPDSARIAIQPEVQE
jgi:rod shape-determining protein MreC